MTFSAIGAALTALAPLILAILDGVLAYRAKKRESHEKLADHSRSELRLGTERVRTLHQKPPAL